MRERDGRGKGKKERGKEELRRRDGGTEGHREGGKDVTRTVH